MLNGSLVVCALLNELQHKVEMSKPPIMEVNIVEIIHKYISLLHKYKILFLYVINDKYIEVCVMHEDYIRDLEYYIVDKTNWRLLEEKSEKILELASISVHSVLDK